MCIIIYLLMYMGEKLQCKTVYQRGTRDGLYITSIGENT